MIVFNPDMTSPRFVKSKVAIVTFTDGTRSKLIEKCKASVAADLPEGAVHYIVPVKGLPFYAQQRQEALLLGDFVAFVDDDDTVMNNAISLCLKAITSENYGIAFTDEAIVEADGKTSFIRQGVRTYENIREWGTAIHHLTMIRSSAVKDDLIQLRGRIQGVDAWIIRSAIKAAGAIHIPVIGYNWTQSANSLSKTMRNLTVPKLEYLQTGLIPVYRTT